MTAVAQHVRFDTAALPVAEKFDYWCARYREMVDSRAQMEQIGTPRSNWEWSAEILVLGDVMLVGLHCAPTMCRWESGTAHDLVRITLFYRTRSVTGHWHGRDVPLSEQMPMLAFRAAGWWSAPLGARSIQLVLPRSGLAVDDALVNRILDRPLPFAVPVFAALVRPMLLGVAGRLAALSGSPVAEQRVLWLSAVTLLLRSLDTLSPDAVAPAAERDLVRYQQIQRFVDARLGDTGLAPDTLAAALRMSRRTLYRLLADEQGVAAMIRRRRLARAHALLSDPAERHRSIGDIATQVGLPSTAAFSRLFRAAYGCSPREFRARHARI